MPDKLILPYRLMEAENGLPGRQQRTMEHFEAPLTVIVAGGTLFFLDPVLCEPAEPQQGVTAIYICPLRRYCGNVLCPTCAYFSGSARYVCWGSR